MSDDYTIASRDLVWATLVGAFVLAGDLLLKVISQLASCSPAADGSRIVIIDLLYPTGECRGLDLVGTAIRLDFGHRDTALFGLGEGQFGEPMGLTYAAGLLAIVILLTVLVARWKWHAGSDAHAMAAIWAGTIIECVPRFVSQGPGLAELTVMGVPTGIGDLAIIWGLWWLLLRLVAELRA